MNTKEANIVSQRSSLFPVALASIALLQIPLIVMQFTDEVNWGFADFAAMGLLLFGTGSLFQLISRKMQRKHRTVVTLALTILFLYIWAELGVGIFTTIGS